MSRLELQTNNLTSLPLSVSRAIRREIIKSAASGKTNQSDITGILEASSQYALLPPRIDENVKRNLINALDNANKHVLDALSTASRNVTQALDRANRDVEVALYFVAKKKPSVGAGDIGTGLRNDESLEMDSTHAKVSSSTPTHLDSTLSPINDYKIGKYQTSDCFPEPLANCDPTLTDSTMINASDLIGSYQSLQSTAADNNGGFFSEAAFMTATGGLCTGTSEKVGGLGATGFEQTTDATETGYYSSEESDQGGGGGQYEYGAGGASGSDGAGGSDDPPGGSSSDDVESYSGKKGKCDCPEPCVCYGCPDKPITVPVCDCPDTCQCVGCPVGKEHTCNCKTCYCELCADITREKGTTKEVKQLCHCGNDCLCEKCTSERYTKTACDCEGECICAICPLKDKDCECAICLCSDCELMKRKMNKDMCDCAQCLCETCEKGGGIQIPTKQKIPNISCKCPICLCSDCPSAQKKSCACPVCLCEKCPDLEGKKQYECTCYPKCECDLCPDPSIPKKCTASKVSISKPIPEKKPAPKHKDGCRCPTCCCNPCQSKKSETAMCKCADPCKCNPCSNKAIIPKKDGCKCDKCSCPVCEPIPSHPPECKCAVCCCKPCAGKEDPKEKCVCSECLCGMCKFKPKKTASVECKCSKCQCSPCSSGGGKQQTKSATSIKGDCKCSQCFCIKCTKKPQMSHPPDCKCLQCMCTPCLKKSVSAHAECKCAKCTCNPCSLKKKDAKNCSCAVCRCTDCPIAAKAVTSSEGCKCCPCNCTNCPSKPGGGTPKPSYSAKSIKQCKCTDPCKCSPCAGKDSKSKFPFENIKPCTCTKPCTCSTCPGVDNKKTCSCKDPCSCQNCQNKPSVRESKPTVASTTSIPKTCSCPAPCICQPCSKMSSPSQVACVKCDCNDKSKCKPACSGHQKAAAPTSRCSTEKFPFENIKPCTCKDPCSCEACPGKACRTTKSTASSACMNAIGAGSSGSRPSGCMVSFPMTTMQTTIQYQPPNLSYQPPNMSYQPPPIRSPSTNLQQGTPPCCFEIYDVRKLTDDSLFLKWTPANVPCLTGYEIDVNGCLSHRVRNKNRCMAVLFNIRFDVPITISVYAITTTGRVQPPVTSVFNNC